MSYLKRTTFLLLLTGLFAGTKAQSYQKTEHGISYQTQGITVQLLCYNNATVRVIKHPEGKTYNQESLVVINQPQQVKFSVSEKANEILLKTTQLTVKLNKQTGDVAFATPNGSQLLNEKEKGSTFTPFNDAGNNTFTVKQAYVLDPQEAIYGLGILQDGKMSLRNIKKHLLQGNVDDYVPFVHSIKGWGLYWDNYSPTDFIDTEQETTFESVVGDAIDYYFMYGGNADGVIAQMRNLTGKVPMIPLWAYGYFQCRERYKSQTEVLEVVHKYRELGVPLDCVIQDWQYWGSNYVWNAMEFLDENYSNAQGMINEIHAQNAQLMVVIWSSFGPHTQQYAELKEKGLLLKGLSTWPESGISGWPPNMNYPSGVAIYDPFSKQARDIYWKYASRLYDLGIDGWWMDSTEPDHFNPKPEDYDVQTALGSFRKVRNAFPLMTVGGVYDNQRKHNNNKRVFILTRSAFAGQQRTGANTWSGDVSSSWDALRKQIPAGLNFTLTGNPNFNSDIGGFFAGGYNNQWDDGTAPQNPLYQELYVRWMQQGAFTPMMRSHGTNIKREIYCFGKKGEPIYDALESAINLRYLLLPYIYATAWDVSKNNSSFMRALMMDFPNDKNVWDINNQYMFGKSILVAPIVKAQYTTEKIIKTNEVTGWAKSQENTNNTDAKQTIDFTQTKQTKIYLPQGTVWYDFFTNEKHNGGQEITRQSTIDLIPLYVKAGTILPIGPKVQYATQQAWDKLEIKVYAGANGSFTLYEDEFDNYNYEQGAYTEINMTWNDAAQTLTIHAPKGTYPGMIENRTFDIVMQNGTKKTVNYNGKKIVVNMK